MMVPISKKKKNVIICKIDCPHYDVLCNVLLTFCKAKATLISFFALHSVVFFKRNIGLLKMLMYDDVDYVVF